jgi:hypothetical protein
MTDGQDRGEEQVQAADDSATQGPERGAHIQPATDAVRRERWRRPVPLGWSAAGMTLVI